MYNPIKNSPSIPCYAQYGIQSECAKCIVAGYCKDAKKANRVESAFCRAGQYAELLPDEAKPTKVFAPEKEYSRDDLSALVAFFLDLLPTQFMLIKLRTIHPEKSIEQIAGMLKLPKVDEVNDFFEELCKRYPALRPILFAPRCHQGQN